MAQKVIVYYYRGHTERGAGRSYVWKDGYSETVGGHVLYPYLTKAEARHDAKVRGAKAVFKDSDPRTSNPRPTARVTVTVADLRKIYAAGRKGKRIVVGTPGSKRNPGFRDSSGVFHPLTAPKGYHYDEEVRESKGTRRFIAVKGRGSKRKSNPRKRQRTRR